MPRTFQLNLARDLPLIRQEAVGLKSFFFSGGEPHVQLTHPLPLPGDTVDIYTRINSFNDLGVLLLATDALKRLGVDNIQVSIPYFPAARQDRVMQLGEPLSVKVYADIINAQGYKKIEIFDPHSEVAPALLNNCSVKNNHQLVCLAVKETQADLLVAPDGGALKKIYKVAEYLNDRGYSMDVVECSKHRDVKTGNLSGFKVLADDLGGQDCLIVDDICDGGGTFNGLAVELKKKNAGNLYLFVSHGIFSKGTKELRQHFKTIFTTNSINSDAVPGVVKYSFL